MIIGLGDLSVFNKFDINKRNKFDINIFDINIFDINKVVKIHFI